MVNCFVNKTTTNPKDILSKKKDHKGVMNKTSCCGEIYCVQIALFELSIIKLIQQSKIAYNSLKIIGSFSVLIRYTLIQWKLTNWEKHPCCLCCLINANFALKYLYRDKNLQINDSVYIESKFAINWLQVFYSLTYWRQNCEKKLFCEVLL